MANAPKPDPEALHDEELRGAESTLLEAMLGASKERETATEVIEIYRDGDFKFAFRIRTVTEQENDDCDEKATIYKRDRRAIAPIPIRTVRTKYRSLLITTATVAFCERTGDKDDKGNYIYRDVEIMWNRDDVLRSLDVGGAWEVVDKVLLPGEKDRVIERINELSGFGDPGSDAVEQAKN